jgi:iron complex transport system permease protein
VYTGKSFFWLALAVLAVLIALAFLVGRFPVAPDELLSVLWSTVTGAAHSTPSATETVILQVRGPRVLAAVLIGAALSASGATFQGMFKNPLVSPDILGVSAGASLGAVIAIYLSFPILAIQGLAFAGGIVAVLLILLVASMVRGHDPVLSLILSGVAIGTLLGSAVALFKYLADPFNQLPAMTFWLLGSLAGIAPTDMLWMALLIAVSLAPLYLLRWRINLLSLSDDEARALGVDVKRLRAVVVVAATLMTAASVAVAGIIGWIGLIIPHAARLLVGPEFARLLPASMLLGAVYMLAIDTLARTVSGVEIPPGILTALIGTPWFIWLLARSGRKPA